MKENLKNKIVDFLFDANVQDVIIIALFFVIAIITAIAGFKNPMQFLFTGVSVVIIALAIYDMFNSKK